LNVTLHTLASNSIRVLRVLLMLHNPCSLSPSLSQTATF